MKFPILKTTGIVIDEKDFKEGDKIFTVYTLDFGKIRILGKGIRKIQAKLKCTLQILNLVSLEFIKGKNFYIATDAFLKNNFFKIKNEIRKFRQALYISWLLNNFIRGEEKDLEIWNLLIEVLEEIEENKNDWLFLRYFEWRLFHFLGIGPELFFCIFCQKRVSSGKIYFSLADGGVLCQNCREKFSQKEFFPLSLSALKILRVILLKKKNILIKIRCENSLKEELKNLSQILISEFLKKPIYLPF